MYAVHISCKLSSLLSDRECSRYIENFLLNPPSFLSLTFTLPLSPGLGNKIVLNHKIYIGKVKHFDAVHIDNNWSFYNVCPVHGCTKNYYIFLSFNNIYICFCILMLKCVRSFSNRQYHIIIIKTYMCSCYYLYRATAQCYYGGGAADFGSISKTNIFQNTPWNKHFFLKYKNTF